MRQRPRVLTEGEQRESPPDVGRLADEAVLAGGLPILEPVEHGERGPGIAVQPDLQFRFDQLAEHHEHERAARLCELTPALHGCPRLLAPAEIDQDLRAHHRVQPYVRPVDRVDPLVELERLLGMTGGPQQPDPPGRGDGIDPARRVCVGQRTQSAVRVHDTDDERIERTAAQRRPDPTLARKLVVDEVQRVACRLDLRALGRRQHDLLRITPATEVPVAPRHHPGRPW